METVFGKISIPFLRGIVVLSTLRTIQKIFNFYSLVVLEAPVFPVFSWCCRHFQPIFALIAWCSTNLIACMHAAKVTYYYQYIQNICTYVYTYIPLFTVQIDLRLAFCSTWLISSSGSGCFDNVKFFNRALLNNQVESICLHII